MEMLRQFRQVQRLGIMQPDIIQDPVGFAQLMLRGNLSHFALVNFKGFEQFPDDLEQNAADFAQIGRVQV